MGFGASPLVNILIIGKKVVMHLLTTMLQEATVST